MTLVAAAICPHPPLLVPRVGAGEPVAAREPALAAVRRLRAAGPDLVVVVGDDPEALAAGSLIYPPTAVGDFRGFGVDFRVPLGPGARGAPGGAALPLSLAVGAWLLAEAGVTAGRRGLGVSPKAEPAEAAALGAGLVEAAAAAGERVALLVMGDGSARRTPKAPGSLDDRAGPYDAVVERALATVDLDTLLSLEPGLAADLLVAGRASWQVLAGALRAAGTGGWASDVLYADAPYGVGYFVCLWEPEVPGDGVR
ncbi:class III extradiol dioxygenase subunit B-like domain-containing protein [Frankia sp. CNm7]|uniref:Class III extradiol dioxygenase subunit B-like domain-containing protein n=1 Tax=Frankia nepalensis TaxID=1836974 RepID=A0A937RLX9_9ACTN|nr:class III extradiol dioxygenase subunit B-like domain-containing protein [Frankia nepalensis]MBL7501024.1 class III extradiol dioxygenase subunit B-like domain-containing protein [Frankia nepalensis]MBL7512499.1 class III extradiol dioxygenase subunit B-like domain-containing protein [Frankia nepalensis]MBL7521473.1 class III extradiol dioxygenase subunit B-like domain-containing protein [Frankia nepalensis]MBL7632802.1 class III extradiol dioxygenase subunit B-like domain-containing protein